MTGELRRLPDRPAGRGRERKPLDENDNLMRGTVPMPSTADAPDPEWNPNQYVERPRIKITSGFSTVVDRAIEALATRDVFQRHGVLVDVVREADERGGVVRPDGTPRIRQIPGPRLGEQLGECAVWLKRKKTDDGISWVRTSVPLAVISAVAARGEWAHLRPLEGIVEWPVLRPDGSVLSVAGYDQATRLICAPNVSVNVPSHPTQGDARRALDTLIDVVADFPFETTAHRTSWLAMLLSLVARPAIDGPVPIGILDATERGTGKTLLADLIGTIVTGRALPRRTVPADKAEWDKAMLAICIAADPIVLLDNVTTVLRSDALDAVLTGTGFRGRLLGRNEEIILSALTVFVATMNNAMLSADLVRRALHARLNARQEHPEQRAGFRHADLLVYARAHRSDLIGAALTVLRAYVVAGRPAVTIRPMGSFEAWSVVVRSALVWLGEPDPAGTQDALREGADTEREAALVLMDAWSGHFGDRKVTAAEVVHEINDEDLARNPSVQRLREAVVGLVDPSSSKVPTAAKLGYRLRRLRGKIVRDFLLESPEQDRNGVALWQIRRAGDQGIAGDEEKRTHRPSGPRERPGASPAMPRSPADEEREAIQAETGE